MARAGQPEALLLAPRDARVPLPAGLVRVPTRPEKLEDVSDPHLSQDFACEAGGVGVPCVCVLSGSPSVKVK